MDSMAKKLSLNPKSGHGLWSSALFGLFFSLLFGLAAAAIVCLFLCKSDDPTPLILPCGHAILGVVAVLCGLFSAKRYQRGRLLPGMLCGALLLLLLFALSTLTEARGLSLLATVLLHLTVFLLVLLGSALGAPRSRRKKHRR